MKIKGHIDQYKYQQTLLDSGVFTSINPLHDPDGWLFMDHGDLSHRAHSTQAFLSRHCPIMPKNRTWPPYLPDLNPRENGWGILKSKINMEGRQDAETLYEQAQVT
jgi:hypothetical protein